MAPRQGSTPIGMDKRERGRGSVKQKAVEGKAKQLLPLSPPPKGRAKKKEKKTNNKWKDRAAERTSEIAQTCASGYAALKRQVPRCKNEVAPSPSLSANMYLCL